MEPIEQFRIKRRGKVWGVQVKKVGAWFWRWTGPFGAAHLGKWERGQDALWFANLCEKVAKREFLKG